MVDRVEIVVKAGRGGDGASSLRHEKFIPFGGPDGGDGGKGGDVYLVASDRLQDLEPFKAQRRFEAEVGGRGGGKRMHGRNGENLFVEVPVGTAVSYRDEAGHISPLGDLLADGDRVMVARGGPGGIGNARFATPTHQAPEKTTRGKPGVERNIIMEVKVVLDVAIVSLPNAGKSMLLSALTAARPKVADYPFTTTEPVLGIAEVGYERLVLGELPALVPGACAGKGLGASFLRHAERAKAVLFLLDGASENISGDLMALSGELASYGAGLAGKARAIAINKVDLPEVAKRMPALKRALRSSGTPVFFVSALSGEGLSEMMPKLVELVRSSSPPAGTEPPVTVFRPRGVKKAETRPGSGGVKRGTAPFSKN